MAAAPSPSTARAAISSAEVVENAHAAELTPNSTRAISSSFFRPIRSPIRPAGSSAAASTRLYAAENHCRSVVEGVQLGGQHRQRQAEHGQVEPDNEHARRDCQQRPPLAGIRSAHGHHPRSFAQANVVADLKRKLLSYSRRCQLCSTLALLPNWRLSVVTFDSAVRFCTHRCIKSPRWRNAPR